MGECTDLHDLIPAARHNDGVLGVGAEANARDPLGVALVRDGVLALAESVPELDGSVARARGDLTVVGRETDGKNIARVPNESLGRGARGELPQTKSLVPRGRESVGTVRRNDLALLVSTFFLYPAWLYIKSIRSPTRCANGHGGTSWGIRIATHPV